METNAMTKSNMNEQLVDDLRVVLEKAEELLKATEGGSSRKLEVAREKLMQGISTIRNAQSQIQEKAADALKATGRVVKEHPYETAGGGLAVILALLGAILWFQRSR